MTWRDRLQNYPLRVKMLITLGGAAVVLLGASTHLSFTYWKAQAEAAAEQQALLAAASGRASVEAALQLGRHDQARRALTQLAAHAPVVAARVYGADGTIVVSHDRGEEGERPRAVWLPRPNEMPEPGLVRTDADAGVVRAFVRVTVPPAAMLELDYALGPVRAAMDRGARLGLLLVIGSLFALAAILFMMLEREVVAPLERMSGLIGGGTGRNGSDELRGIERGFTQLLQKEQDAEVRMAEHERRIQAQAGLVQIGEIATEMAHEFKRPIASIQSAVQLLSQEYVLEERGQHLIRAVDEQLAHLSETMRDLFMLAKPADISTHHVPLRELMQGAIEQIAGHPALNGIEVRIELPDEATSIECDVRRLELAVLNLMLNAAEAMSGSGTLTISAGASEHHAIIEVSDTGVGIPAAEIERVLLPFYSTKPGGTGLGLPLVARVVAAHGGRLELSSEPNAGTTARMELPLAAAAPTREEPWQLHVS